MRAIFLVLLLGNLLLLALQWVGPAEQSPGGASASAVSDRVPSLALLSEQERQRSPNRPTPPEPALRREQEPVASSAELAATPLCTLLGAFSDPAAAEPVVQRLRALDIEAQVRNIEVPDGTGYWVYLPPELSRRAALRRLHELQAKQIDSYVIPRGELANGISFGMYTREPLAHARQEEMIARGYDAQIREIDRTQRETWVSLAPEDAHQLGDELWNSLRERFPNLERRQNFCPGVASE